MKAYSIFANVRTSTSYTAMWHYNMSGYAEMICAKTEGVLRTGLRSHRTVLAGIKFTQDGHTTQLLYNKLCYSLLLELTS